MAMVWKSKLKRIDKPLYAGETVLVGQAVCIKDNASTVWLAAGSDINLAPCLGIAGNGASIGGPVEVVTEGVLAGITASVEGEEMFLAASGGGIDQTGSTYKQILGRALSATEMYVQISNIYGTLGALAVQTGHIANDAVTGAKASANLERKFAKSQVFDLDGAATIDDVILVPSNALTIDEIRIVYVDATSGTVAAGHVRVGTILNGQQILTSVNGAYENAKAVGYYKDCVITSGAVAANTPIFVRHTSVAATQAGKAFVQIEFLCNDA